VNTRRLISCILLACAVGAGLAACSSSSSTTSSAPSSPAAVAPSATSTGSGSSSDAEKAITANWTAFFSPKTPVDKRVSLLQNGSTFASVIRAQASSSLASEASAEVTKVTVTSPSQATVIYTVLLAGTPALSNQKGVAVYQDGTWKVGVASFCGLLTLENSGKPLAVCKAAG
jgi:hypothetical protein